MCKKNIRTCVICKKKSDKVSLDRFLIIDNEIVLDIFHKVPNYGYYICNDNFECGKSFKNFLKKRNIKRFAT